MQYFASHYRQPDDCNATSLVLQQAYHKRRKLPVLLACVCTDGLNCNVGRKVNKSLAAWFYESGLSLCAAYGERGIQAINDSLERCLRKCVEQTGKEKIQETLEFHMAGILCVGNSLRMFGQGGQRISLLNLRNQRPHSRNLELEMGDRKGLVFQDGVMQSGVGILLATEGFHAHIPQKEMETCLNVQELCSQSRLDRRLGELGSLGESRGSSDMAAVLLVAR